MNFIMKFLVNIGINIKIINYIYYVLTALFLIGLCLLINLFVKKIVLKIISKYIINNRFKWDDVIIKHKLLERIVNVIPGIIVYNFAPYFYNYDELVRKGATIYIIIIIMLIINEFLNVINDIYRSFPISKVRPITGLLQVVKIVVYIIIGILIIADLMGKDPLVLLGGIGAFAAVFSFVFKDAILGFIAGIQLTSNDMLRIGDWIDMSKYGADGDVVDITLTTVVVQNFDKTIVTIPAYALISDSFKNWRGMKEFGGRRIKRAIYIDVNSISFCTHEMIEKFKKIDLLKDYLADKEYEIENYNKEKSLDEMLQINGRHLTNIGTFRAYVMNYIKNHPGLLTDRLLIVRQLAPEDKGLPIEIYGFTATTDWVQYEDIQSDIFDHVLAVVGEFGLRVFQKPSGRDLDNLKS
ncbi:MAG TPA: mechanosensitive ion channel [Clostridiales bacterium]|nr:mechanosensitive ion channel [Clostridiales bacterium]